VGAPCCLTVDGDEVVPIWPQRRHPTRKAMSEQDRIDPVDELAQPAPTECRDGTQKTCPRRKISSKSSQLVIVAQTTSSITSLSGT
jgi:hypothetical protein